MSWSAPSFVPAQAAEVSFAWQPVAWENGQFGILYNRWSMFLHKVNHIF